VANTQLETVRPSEPPGTQIVESGQSASDAQSSSAQTLCGITPGPPQKGVTGPSQQEPVEHSLLSQHSSMVGSPHSVASSGGTLHTR
jgi:hypothetical protein